MKTKAYNAWNTLAAVDQLRRHMRRDWAAELPPGAWDLIETGIFEALTNVVRHAYSGTEEGAGLFWVNVSWHAKQIVVEITDRGIPLPLNLLQDQSKKLEFDPTVLEEIPEGGIGVAIIQKIVDKLEYERRADSNVLRLIKIIESPLT